MLASLSLPVQPAHRFPQQMRLGRRQTPDRSTDWRQALSGHVDESTGMYLHQLVTDTQITTVLSQLLGRDITHVQSEPQGSDLPGTVFKVSALDNERNEYPLILKRRSDDRDYRLYKHYLEPFRLNSPRIYGHVEIDGQGFVVMDYIRHVPPNWGDRGCYLEAVRWLINKDLITSRNLSSIRSLDCLGEMKYFGVDYWLPIFERWYKDSKHDNQSEQIWSIVDGNRRRIAEYIDDLNESGPQTVVHGDFGMGNILFGDEEYKNMLYVIDWTEPHIGSVTNDLAHLYDNAPINVKGELITTYREHIDFHRFEDIFGKARVLRDLGYLAWMVEKINEGEREGDYQDELARVAKSLISSLS